jgi:hypothetical protein
MNVRMVCAGLLLLGCLGFSPRLRAEEKAAKPPAMQVAFEQLKQLAGDWVMTGADGKPGPAVTNTFRVTAAGSAVVETLFPGTDHEMVTIYHLDGDDLVLTHYCALKNQPRLRAERSADPKKIAFKFTGGTNMKSDKDHHMHDMTFHFLDADHVKVEGCAYADGKQSETMVFDLTRKKK